MTVATALRSISVRPKNIPMIPTIISIRSTYVVRKLKKMKNKVLSRVANRNRVIENVCSVRFAWYPKYSRETWMMKKKMIVANSTSQMFGG